MSKPPSIASQRIRPTLETQFHIDYEWWNREERDLRIYLLSHLEPEQRAFFDENREAEEIDWIDPDTAEVQRVDALQRALQEASKSPDFVSTQTSLVDAVFRVFLANNNQPLTPIQLGEITGRAPITILRTMSGQKVYKGIRPVVKPE